MCRPKIQSQALHACTQRCTTQRDPGAGHPSLQLTQVNNNGVLSFCCLHLINPWQPPPPAHHTPQPQLIPVCHSQAGLARRLSPSNCCRVSRSFQHGAATVSGASHPRAPGRTHLRAWRGREVRRGNPRVGKQSRGLLMLAQENRCHRPRLGRPRRTWHGTHREPLFVPGQVGS